MRPRPPFRLHSLTIGFALALAVQATGCTAIEKQEAKSTDQLLSASGFVIRPADTPEKMASLQAMKQRKMVRRQTPDGQLQFLWADALVCRCLFVGNEQAYQTYQSLAVQQQIADANQQAALDASMDGPYGYDWWGMPYPY